MLEDEPGGMTLNMLRVGLGLNARAPSAITIGQRFNGLVDVRFTNLDAPNTTLGLFRFNGVKGPVGSAGGISFLARSRRGPQCLVNRIA